MDAATETMIRSIEQKTGRKIEHWLEVVRATGTQKHGEVVKMLKSDHGFGHGYANLVVHLARGGLETPSDSSDQLEEAMFAGKRSATKPAYDALRTSILSLGTDVEVSPKKSYVSFRRKKQFALAQPSTVSRLDVGLSLKGVQPGGRLESAAGFNAMCTHRVRVESPDEIDDELLGWVRRAYDAAG
jgi:predicted transport protein